MNQNLLTLDNQTNIGDFFQNIIGDIGFSNPTSQDDYQVAKIEAKLNQLIPSDEYSDIKNVLNQNQITMGAKYNQVGQVTITDNNQIAKDLKNIGVTLNQQALNYLFDNLLGRFKNIQNFKNVSINIATNHPQNLDDMVVRVQIQNIHNDAKPIVQNVIKQFGQLILENKLSTHLVNL